MTEVEQQIVNLVKSGMSLRKAARQLGMNYTTLRYKAVNLGLHKPKTKNTKNGKATCKNCGKLLPLSNFPQLLSNGKYQCNHCIHLDAQSLAQYEELVSKFGEQCQICGVEVGHGKDCKLAIDHCHQTGQIRGLLCNKCNRGIGFLQDDIALLQNAIQYLKANRV